MNLLYPIKSYAYLIKYCTEKSKEDPKLKHNKYFRTFFICLFFFEEHFLNYLGENWMNDRKTIGKFILYFKYLEQKEDLKNKKISKKRMIKEHFIPDEIKEVSKIILFLSDIAEKEEITPEILNIICRFLSYNKFNGFTFSYPTYLKLIKIQQLLLEKLFKNDNSIKGIVVEYDEKSNKISIILVVSLL